MAAALAAPAVPAAPGRPFRLAFLFAVVCLSAMGLGARLVHWQVGQSAPLQRQLSAQHTLDETVPARRGVIRDVHGDLLAGNLSVDYVYAQPTQIRNPADVAARVAPVLGVSPESLLPTLSDSTRAYARLLGGRKVSPETSQQLAALRTPGIFLEPTTRRTYPERQLAAHLLGFVDGDGQGWYGLEGQYTALLGGRPGRLQAERDTAGNEIGFSNRQWLPPEDGKDIVLTIDRTIQYIAERELDRAIAQHRASGGTVIVIQPRTGALLAMASRPAFDPNRYEEFAERTELFANPAITHLYEPGSTFKLVTMSGALNEKVVTPQTTYVDTGSLFIGGYTIHNWDRKANGVTNMVQLLEKSANIGASWVAFRLGKERFYKYVTAFGFGQPTGIDLQGELPGIVRSPALKDWAEVDLATNSFGQAVSVTPIQMAVAVAAIANGGVMMRPYVVDKIVDPHTGSVRKTQPQAVRQVISRETATTLLDMMVSVVENGETKGTLVPGYRVGGKTGTASIPVAGGYDPNWTIASFVGVVPVDEPQFAIVVKIDRPQDEPWGSLIAKPAFGIIAQELARYYKVRPTEPVQTPTAVPARPTAPPQRSTPPARPPAPPPAAAGRTGPAGPAAPATSGGR